MSVAPLTCSECRVACLFDRVGPPESGPHSYYLVGWKCPQCGRLQADMCPVGPLVPGEADCLNCGGAFNGADSDPGADGDPGAGGDPRDGGDPGDGGDPTDGGDRGSGRGPRCAACDLSPAEVDAFLDLPSNLVDGPAAFPEVEWRVRSGRLRAAIGLANRILTADPGFAPAWQVKLELLEALGFHEQVVTVASAAFERTADPAYRFSAAFALQESNRHAEAVEAYEAYLQHPALSPAQQGMALANQANSMLALGDAARAEALFRQAIELDAAQPTHYANFVRLLHDQKRFAEAMDLAAAGLRHAPADGPERIRLLEDHALFCAEASQGKPALASIDEAIALGGSSVRTHYLRARALALVGRLSEARGEVLRVLAKDPANADANRALRLIDDALKRS